MQCNGKCYLSKKIKAQEEQEQKIPSVVKGLDKLVLFCSTYSISIQNSISSFYSIFNPAYFLKYYKSPLAGILQPPQ